MLKRFYTAVLLRAMRDYRAGDDKVKAEVIEYLNSETYSDWLQIPVSVILEFLESDAVIPRPHRRRSGMKYVKHSKKIS